MNKSNYFHQSIQKSRYRYSITPNQNFKHSSLRKCEMIEYEFDSFDECDLEVYNILLQPPPSESDENEYFYGRSYFPPLLE